MAWRVRVAKRAQKKIESLPAKDRRRICLALESMQDDPFGGDLIRLKAERTAWRRRVGSYRIFFDIDPDHMLVDIVEIARRTSTTY